MSGEHLTVEQLRQEIAQLEQAIEAEVKRVNPDSGWLQGSRDHLKRLRSVLIAVEPVTP